MSLGSFFVRRFQTMSPLILEFNQFERKVPHYQSFTVRFADGKKLPTMIPYAYTDKPLKSFINGLTGITSDKILQAPPLEQVLEVPRFLLQIVPSLDTMPSEVTSYLAENGLEFWTNFMLLMSLRLLNRPSDLRRLKLAAPYSCSVLGGNGKSTIA